MINILYAKYLDFQYHSMRHVWWMYTSVWLKKEWILFSCWLCIWIWCTYKLMNSFSEGKTFNGSNCTLIFQQLNEDCKTNSICRILCNPSICRLQMTFLWIYRVASSCNFQCLGGVNSEKNPAAAAAAEDGDPNSQCRLLDEETTDFRNQAVSSWIWIRRGKKGILTADRLGLCACPVIDWGFTFTILIEALDSFAFGLNCRMKFKAAARQYNMNVPEDMKARIVVLIDVVVRNCKLYIYSCYYLRTYSFWFWSHI